jgi:hypothetical protein
MAEVSTVNDLAQFLRDRYAEIGANAERMRDAVWPAEVYVWPTDNNGYGPQEPHARVTIAPQYTKRYATIWEPDERGLPVVDDSWHMFTASVPVWSPEVAGEILADVDAKLRVVEACDDTMEWEDRNTGASLAEQVLRLLALPFAGHSDYRAEWAVD